MCEKYYKNLKQINVSLALLFNYIIYLHVINYVFTRESQTEKTSLKQLN